MPFATIKITGDPDSSGSTRTGVFELMSGIDQNGGATRTYSQRTGYVTEGAGASVNAFIGDVIGSKSNTKGVYSTPGGSQFTIELEADVSASDGGQWGDTGNGGSKTDATGEGPGVKADVLAFWLRNVALDSLPAWAQNTSAGPATLEVGEYSSSGRYDPLDVVLESPTIDLNSATPSTAAISVTCIEAADLSEAWDAVAREVF